MSTWYDVGTVSVTNGSATVIGSLTAWLINAKPGDAFNGPDGERYQIIAVASNTSMTISPAYAGSTASGQSYAIERIAAEWHSVSELSVSIAEMAEAFQRGFAMRSTSSVEIGDGEHEFAVPSGLPILPGARLLFSSAADPATHWMEGVVTSYEGTSLEAAVAAGGFAGSGTRSDWSINIAGRAAPAGGILGVFHKADPYSVAFTKTGAGTISLKAGTVVEVGGALHAFDETTPVTMPSLTGGTDYAVYVCADSSVRADASFSAPDGYTTETSRRIGGFHYAPGGNAAAQDGGDTTPAINEYSLWDLKWRPACPDPRGMALVAGSFWCDIYLLGVDHQVNGTSRNNVTIADGSSPPKIPLAFGGNGSSTYSNLTQWVAGEVLASHGKRLLTYHEFAAAAYGVKENAARGNDPVTTGLGTTNAGSSNADEKFTSKWGIIQATGCLYDWGDELAQLVNGADYAAAIAPSWKNVAGGRGQVYTQGATISLSAARLGGGWSSGGNSGSRCSHWYFAPSISTETISSRGCSDHLCLV